MVELSAVPRRSTTGVVFSLVVHLIMGVGVAGFVPGRAVQRHGPAERVVAHLTFDPDEMRTLLNRSAPEPSEIALPAPVPAPSRTPASPVSSPPAAEPEPAPAVPVAAAVAALNTSTLPPALMQPSQQVQPSFTPPAEVRPREVVGTFDERHDSAARRPVEAPARAVVAAGFGSAEPARPVAGDRSSVRSAGFDARAAAPVPVVAQRQPIDTPVAIVFKPEPRYTDEAKALRIEGQVVLDVEFTATGEVRVLAVLAGLGHGLDEAAARATEQIRFRPARAAGSAVDFRAIVHVQFRLS